MSRDYNSISEVAPFLYIHYLLKCFDLCFRDSDGVQDSLDNCPVVLNPDQLDTDKDAIGKCHCSCIVTTAFSLNCMIH